ncbi:lambda family phage portal protein [Rhodobacter sp. JA431]|uniref:phage portal protein n=1 Tax=Rhodobacter sp. JA431 TaxID=570013 RepID=UPI000BDD897C|nr:phage portal protein [Rhodobacter sp. JA431]SOC13776.1 lambda family phage portal protein [Rhodobacter sp. JA431]
MNPIDAVVNYFNPVAGARRVMARARTATVMNYDAASRGRRSYGWKSPGTAADAAAFGARARLRNLSRDMIRNRPYAMRGRDVVVANVVGEGIMPSIVAEEGAKAQIEEILRAHLLTPAMDALGEYDLLELQQIVMSAVFSDGEVLLRRRMRNTRFNAGLPLPYQVELIEVDLLDTTVQSWGQNLVEEGIEYGPTGAIEAYHILSEHPGAVRNRKAPTTTRVHWSDIIHVRRFDRPGQLRGVPWLAPVMMTLGELSDYQEGQILKQKMAALMAAVIEYPDGVTRPAQAGAGLEELAPGAMVELPEGAKAQFTNPPVVDGYDEFMRRGLQAVAVGLGVTYESLAGDLKNVNFSSGRMGRNEMDRLIRMWQRSMMIGQLGVGLERWFRDGLRLIGLGHLAFSLHWTPPRRILIDPTKEVPAMIEEIEAGLNSRQNTQRELGRDPDRIRAERAEDQEKDAAANLAPILPKSPQGATGSTKEEKDNAEDRP